MVYLAADESESEKEASSTQFSPKIYQSQVAPSTYYIDGCQQIANEMDQILC